MPAEPTTPAPEDLPGVLEALRGWQREGAAVPLHPGDVGWFWRFGADATVAALRTWHDDGRLVAVGLTDDSVLRLAVDPGASADAILGVAQGLVTTGVDVVEVRDCEPLRAALRGRGWVDDEPWTPLRLDLADPVPDPGAAVVVVGPDEVADRVAVQRAAFEGSTFSEERWHAMAGGPAYADARCLVAYDDGTAAAAVTVWSAGEGRPGLLEPMGVHRDHRGRGLGRAITLAAAAALRGLGSSSAVVCTPSANAAGVAAYRSAGFVALPEVTDLRRPTPPVSLT